MAEFFTWIIDKIIESKELKLATQKDKSAIISQLKLSIKITDRHIETSRDKNTDEDIYSETLVIAWQKVAELIRPYDRSLAEIFDSKSDYWNNPKKFMTEIRSHTRKFDFRFRLTEVKKIEAAMNQAWF